MTDKPTPSRWAVQRAADEIGYLNGDKSVDHICTYPQFYPVIIVLARYIEVHEEPPAPPVDPLLLRAREITAEMEDDAGFLSYAAKIRAGKYDDSGRVQSALRAKVEEVGDDS